MNEQYIARKIHSNAIIYLVWVFIAFIILFFVSPDSYFNDLHSRVDSACFFMNGKAMMNGLAPYVDFADSKGPLLMLIYGLGYLLSHTTYLGVFWISVLWYSFTFYFLFRLALLFLKDFRKATLAVLLTIPFLFLPWFHDEIRAEDFGVLFLVITIYYSCSLLYCPTTIEKKKKRAFFVMGLCTASLFLIKWNFAIIQLFCPLYVLLFMFKSKNRVVPSLICFLVGFIAFVFPFSLYLWTKGSFNSFIQEYFLNTFLSVQTPTLSHGTNALLQMIPVNSHFLIVYLCEWADLIYHPATGFLFIVLVFGGLLWGSTQQRHQYFPLCFSLFAFAILMRHHFDYYFVPLLFLPIFFSIWTIHYFSRDRKKIHKGFAYFICVISVCLTIVSHFLLVNFKTAFFNDNINRKNFYQISAIMSQIEKPKVISAFWLEQGFGIANDALPAGQYWYYQNGSTPEMDKGHVDLILSGAADFITVFEPDLLSHELSLSTLENHGYYVIYEFKTFLWDNSEVNTLLLTKHQHLLIPKVSVSIWDVLFKRGFHIVE